MALDGTRHGGSAPVDDALQGGSPSTIGPIQSAFTTAVELLQAGRASLLLQEGTEPVLTVAASIGIEAQLIPSIRVAIGRGVAGVVAERGISLFGTVGADTFISAPIITDRGVEGTLNVTHRHGDHNYTVADIDQVRPVAAHIAHLLQYGRAATRDPVSDLPNRKAFEDALKREVAQSTRTAQVFTVVFLDLDEFKIINDRFGHARGDDVIRGVGSALQRILRPYDFAGRYGGDEFALLLPGTPDSYHGIMERISEAISNLSVDMQVAIEISIGLARWPDDGHTASELVAAADTRMYEHKRSKMAQSG